MGNSYSRVNCGCGGVYRNAGFAKAKYYQGLRHCAWLRAVEREDEASQLHQKRRNRAERQRSIKERKA